MQRPKERSKSTQMMFGFAQEHNLHDALKIALDEKQIQCLLNGNALNLTGQAALHATEGKIDNLLLMNSTRILNLQRITGECPDG